MERPDGEGRRQPGDKKERRPAQQGAFFEEQEEQQQHEDQAGGRQQGGQRQPGTHGSCGMQEEKVDRPQEVAQVGQQCHRHAGQRFGPGRRGREAVG